MNMALIKCPECGHELSEMAHVCPHCGCPVKNLRRMLLNPQIPIKGTIPYIYNNVILTTKKSHLSNYIIISLGYILLTLTYLFFWLVNFHERQIILQTVIFAYSSILFILFAMWEYNICNNMSLINTFFPYSPSEVYLAWLLPIVQLFKPYLILKAAWQEIEKESKNHHKIFLFSWWSLESFNILSIYVCVVIAFLELNALISYCFISFNISSIFALSFRMLLLYRYRIKEIHWIKVHKHTPYITFI